MKAAQETPVDTKENMDVSNEKLVTPTFCYIATIRTSGVASMCV